MQSPQGHACSSFVASILREIKCIAAAKRWKAWTRVAIRIGGSVKVKLFVRTSVRILGVMPIATVVRIPCFRQVLTTWLLYSKLTVLVGASVMPIAMMVAKDSMHVCNSQLRRSVSLPEI